MAFVIPEREFNEYLAIRIKCMCGLDCSLSKYISYTNLYLIEKQRIIINMEMGIYLKSCNKMKLLFGIDTIQENMLQFERCYNTTFVKLSMLLDPLEMPNNTELISKVVSPEITTIELQDLCNQEYYKLMPTTFRGILDELIMRTNEKITTRTCEFYKCRNCGHNKTSVYSLQIRSGDEGSTLFITCQFCSNKWTINA